MVTMVVEGIAIACLENGCALLGGETAEMPSFYDDGEYDLAGFIVGVVDRNNYSMVEQLREATVSSACRHLVYIPTGIHLLAVSSLMNSSLMWTHTLMS